MLEISSSGVAPGRRWRDFPSPLQTNHPVVGISQNEAQDFCEWLTSLEKRTGRLAANQRYALPTSEQWDRMVGPATYPWGADFPPDVLQGNYAGGEVKDHANSGGWPEVWLDFVLNNHSDGSWPRTTPVGRYQLAPDKFADLGGNAAEWCRDVFRPEMNRGSWTNASRRLREEGSSGHFVVVRGAAWRDHDRDLLRSHTCWAEPPDLRTDWLGFRIVLEEGQ
jgi:formylglycine-generating enzyme required for sulfatase activity